jgi:hypothetical protein
MHTDADLYLRGTETLLDRGLAARERAEALDAMAAAYADAGITRYAAWAHESDRPLIAELERRGHRLQEWTRVMGMALADLAVPRPELELGSPDWSENLRILEAGCETASLQSSEMAVGVYAGVGFRDLGRYPEFVP